MQTVLLSKTGRPLHEEIHGEIPEFYFDDIKKAEAPSTRECIVEVPDEQIMALWMPTVIPGSIQ